MLTKFRLALSSNQEDGNSLLITPEKRWLIRTHIFTLRISKPCQAYHQDKMYDQPIFSHKTIRMASQVFSVSLLVTAKLFFSFFLVQKPENKRMFACDQLVARPDARHVVSKGDAEAWPSASAGCPDA